MMFAKKERSNDVLLQGGYCYAGPDETGGKVRYTESYGNECQVSGFHYPLAYETFVS
ncbi:MAG: hypothetical protein IJT27_09525 [Clostridia bacterium]|nr:hypothetical protein [Clostridia bacterium]